MGDLAIPNINGVDLSNQNISRGDFEYFTNYPILPQGGAYGDSVGILYAPTYLLVCPDKSAYASYYYGIENDVQSKCGIVLQKQENKVRIYLPELTTCNGSNRINIVGHLRNTGSNNITSARVKLFASGIELARQDLLFSGINNSGDIGLDEFTFENVLLDQNLESYGKGPYKIVVDKLNDVDLTVPFEKFVKIRKDIKQTDNTDLSAELKTDKYVQETSWTLSNLLGNIEFQNSTLQANSIVSNQAQVGMNECYTVRLKDLGGNGIASDGYLKVTTASNELLCDLKKGGGNYENFGYDCFVSFEIGNVLSINSKDMFEGIDFFPNPSNDFLRIEDISVEKLVYDMQGNVVLENQDLVNNDIIDLSFFESGVYFLVIHKADEIGEIKINKQ